MVGPNTQTAYKITTGPFCAGGILRQTGCIAEEHEHPEAQLTLLFHGRAPSLVSHDEAGRTTRTAIASHAFVFVAPNQPHRINWSSYGELLHLWLPQPVLHELSTQTHSPIPISRLGDHPDPAIFSIGRVLIDEFNLTGGLAPAMINHAASLMLARVLRLAERNPRETTTSVLSLQRLQPAIRFITDAPERDFTLLELAALCNSSVFHFARSFTARLGAAPFAFQRTERIRRAKDLLLTEQELSIEAIAFAVGFQNATHFARTFRRHTGLSPSDYRRLNV